MTLDKKVQKLDDEFCYNKPLADPNIDYDCFKCDGYNATCYYYVSIRTMQPLDPETEKEVLRIQRMYDVRKTSVGEK